MGLDDRDYMRDRDGDRLKGLDGPQAKPSPTRKGGLGTIVVLTTILVGVMWIASGSDMRPHVSTGAVEAPVTASDRIQAPVTPQTVGAASPPASPAAPTPDQAPALIPPAASIDQSPTDQPLPAPQEFPASGSVQWIRPSSVEQPLAPLQIADGSGIPGNKVLRVRDGFGYPVLQVYVREGEGAVVRLPVGVYQVNIMIGKDWYGLERQFGAEALYFHGMTMPLGPGGSNYMLLPSPQGHPQQSIPANAY